MAEKLKEFWKRSALPITLVIIALLGGFGIYQYRTAYRLRNAMENSYARAFSELTEDVEELSVSLAKAMVVADSEEMIRLAFDVYRMADGAKTNLGALPMADEGLLNLEKFLSQVGSYCYSVSLSHMEGSPVSAEESKEMQNFYRYARSLGDSLSQVDGALRRGEMFLWDGGTGGKIVTLSQGFSSVEEEFREYPALIYDGPFSEHIEKKEAEGLKNLSEVDRNRAETLVKSALGTRGNVLTFSGEETGKIPAFNFTGEVEEGRELSAQITRAGGKLLWFLDSRQPFETKIEISSAIEKARAFLEAQGYPDMEESYYESKGNVLTVNFAATDGAVILYPDLVKVSVAMDNGEILGMEAKGYLMNHKERTFSSALIGEEAAKAKISPSATATECRLAVIPLDSGKESLSYEWKIETEEHVFLLYVNALSGEVDDLLMLKESPQGILAV